MMMLSVVPFYASAAEALSASNVTQWPTITYKNGGDSIYFGQTVGDTIIINDDEIVLDAAGNQVAGHFEHHKSTRIPDANDAAKANLTFVPDDTTLYTGFNKLFSKDVTFKVNKVTPIPVDENNAFPVATEVEAGANLSTSILTSPEYTNPYNAEEPKILAAKWTWRGDTSNKTVNESGYYQAMLSVGSSGYTDTFAWVLVRVKGDTSEVKMGATIEEKPTVAETVVVGDKYSDLTLVGGKVVGMDGEKLSGKFSFEKDDTFKTAGTVIPTVVFTPDDDRYSSVKTNISFIINPAPIKFVDSNGTEIVPEITVPYGLKMNDDISGYLRPYLNASASFNYEETEYYNTVVPVGTHELTVKASCSDTNYESDAVLSFKLTVEPLEIGIESLTYSSVGGFLLVKPDYAKANGTFAVYANDKLVAEGLKIEGYTFKCDFAPETSGEYNIKVVYTPKENDPCTMADYETKIQVNLLRNITLAKGTMTVNGVATEKYIKAGDIIRLDGLDADEIALWSIKDANGNDVELAIQTVVTHVDENGGITFETVDGDLTSENIIFTMPDCDLTISYKTTAELEREEAIANCDHLCHKDGFLGFIWKIVTFLQRLFGVQQYCDCGNLHYDAPYIDLGL